MWSRHRWAVVAVCFVCLGHHSAHALWNPWAAATQQTAGVATTLNDRPPLQPDGEQHQQQQSGATTTSLSGDATQALGAQPYVQAAGGQAAVGAGATDSAQGVVGSDAAAAAAGTVDGTAGAGTIHTDPAAAAFFTAAADTDAATSTSTSTPQGTTAAQNPLTSSSGTVASATTTTQEEETQSQPSTWPVHQSMTGWQAQGLLQPGGQPGGAQAGTPVALGMQQVLQGGQAHEGATAGGSTTGTTGTATTDSQPQAVASTWGTATIDAGQQLQQQPGSTWGAEQQPLQQPGSTWGGTTATTTTTAGDAASTLAGDMQQSTGGTLQAGVQQGTGAGAQELPGVTTQQGQGLVASQQGVKVGSQGLSAATAQPLAGTEQGLVGVTGTQQVGAEVQPQDVTQQQVVGGGLAATTQAGADGVMLTATTQPSGGGVAVTAEGQPGMGTIPTTTEQQTIAGGMQPGTEQHAGGLLQPGLGQQAGAATQTGLEQQVTGMVQTTSEQQLGSTQALTQQLTGDGTLADAAAAGVTGEQAEAGAGAAGAAGGQADAAAAWGQAGGGAGGAGEQADAGDGAGAAAGEQAGAGAASAAGEQPGTVLPPASAEPEVPPHVWQPNQVVKCPAGCTEYGTCNLELGRCDCPKHMMGADCATPAPPDLMAERCSKAMYADVDECSQVDGQSCLNNCNMRGTCWGGFCHCEPGHFGADCSLSMDFQGRPQLLAGTGYQTRQKRPWIYVYELPPHLTTWMNTKRLDRHTANMFWQRLLSSGARTADPEQADWFFIPIRQRGWGDKAHLAQAIEYISQVWPYWNKLAGHRHFIFATGDLGVADMDPVGRQMAENVTWLSYWGLTKQHQHSGWEPAHRPGKDIVIPVMVSSGHYAHIGMTRSPIHPAYQAAAVGQTTQFRLPAQRDKVFFFAGRVCTNRALPDNSKPPPFNCGPREQYSGGVRQAVYYYYSNRTNWSVKLSDKNYPYALSSHKFCLAPLGGGHGQRQVVVSAMGCIPVTIGDNVMQPFEPELPWNQFSVQVAEADIPKLATILESITDEQYAAMQAKLRCAVQHLVWSSVMGGFQQETGKYDAFETTLEIMRMQMQYPHAKPEEYQQLDDNFRRFMACGADQFGNPPPAPPADNPLCTHSWLDGVSPPTCQLCIRGVSPTHGVPGGIICCNSRRDLSKCPRLWE